MVFKEMSTIEGMIRQTLDNPLWDTIKDMKYEDIYVVEDFDEAEQFRYEHNDMTVEVGTPVGYEGNQGLVCFNGIYFQSDE